MAIICVNVTFIKSANAVFNNLKSENINMQSFLIYLLKYENNPRNINKEFLNLNYCDELDVLATGLKSK